MEQEEKELKKYERKVKYQNFKKLKIQRKNDMWLRDEAIKEIRII